MRSNKLLVLGGTGYIGHHLLPRLATAGYRLTVPSRNREHHRELTLIPGVALHNADIHDRDTLERLVIGHDAVINLVGILNESSDQSFRSVHVELVEKLLAACQQAGVRRLLQMSALKAGQGLSNYLKSRGRMEQAVRASDLDWTILQSSVVFGGRGGLVARFDSLLQWLPVLPLPRPDARMAPVDVDDVASAIVRCLEDPSTRQQTLELYGPETLTLIEIVRRIAHATGKRRWIIPMPDALGKLQASVAGLVPGKPFTRDNFLSLRTEAVGDSDGLQRLGIEAQVFTAMLAQLAASDSRARRYDLMRAQHGQ